MAAAQYSEVGLTGGISYYIGDLNPYAHPSKVIHPGGGVVFRYNPNDRIAFKFNAIYGKIEAHDSDSDEEWRQIRNLHFQSDFFEVGAHVEVNFLTYEIGDRKRPSTPYLFAGFALARFNPKAQYEDQWVALQPLGTEGQGMEGFEDPYNLTQFVIPFGVGFKANLFWNVAVSAEWGFRKTFTDYIDDVSTNYADPVMLEEENGSLAAVFADRSLVPGGIDGDNKNLQRGDENLKDWYVYTGISITVKLGKPQVKCPTAY